MAAVVGDPEGYHGNGVIGPANTDAEAGQDVQGPSEAHPDTSFILEPDGSAAILPFRLDLLLHGGTGLAVGASAMTYASPHQRAFPSVVAGASAPVD